MIALGLCTESRSSNSEYGTQRLGWEKMHSGRGVGTEGTAIVNDSIAKEARN